MAHESMTGYARATRGIAGGQTLVCEMRSVNGKSLELRLRLPAGLERLEIPVRQILQNCLGRGNVQVSIALEQGEANNPPAINHALVESLLALAEKLEQRHGLSRPTVGELLSIRGVMESAPETAMDADEEVLALVRETVEDLKRMRQREGHALVAIMGAHLDKIAGLIANAEQDPSRAPEAIRERLRQQVVMLLDTGLTLDEERLNAEAVLLATRSDICEELDRLKSHVTAARDLLAGSGPAGKKLDFLSQEFNREANTLCSKSNAVTMTRTGLELKAVVDQFREQVQNLE